MLVQKYRFNCLGLKQNIHLGDRIPLTKEKDPTLFCEFASIIPLFSIVIIFTFKVFTKT
jgi:hypothetical protein